MREAVVARLGEGVLGADGEIDRGASRTMVFDDRARLDWLEELLHPRVAAEYLRWREQLARAAEPAARSRVTEVPLLYEAGGDERFDRSS